MVSLLTHAYINSHGCEVNGHIAGLRSAHVEARSPWHNIDGNGTSEMPQVIYVIPRSFTIMVALAIATPSHFGQKFVA